MFEYSRASLGRGLPVALDLSPDGNKVIWRDTSTEGFSLAMYDRARMRIDRILTTQDMPIGVQWIRDGQSIAYFSDNGGDGDFRLWTIDAHTRTRTRVPGVKTRSPTFAPGPSGMVAYVQDRGRGTQRELVVVRPESSRRSKRHIIMRGLSKKGGIAWSPDGRVLVGVPSNDGSIVLASVTGAPSEVVRLFRGGEIRDVTYSDNGRVLLLCARLPTEEYFGLYELDLTTRRVASVVKLNADVSRPRYSGGEGLILFQSNSDGVLRLNMLNQATAQVRQIGYADGSTLLLGFTSGGDSAIASYTGLAEREPLIAIHLADNGVRSAFPTRRLNGVSALQVRVASVNGVVIPGYLWLPVRRDPKLAVIMLHGGPALQVMRTWDAGIETFVRNDIAVLALNYRGSTGYGAHFERASGGMRAQVQDVIAASKFLQERLHVSGQSVAVYGHSYGALLAQHAVAVSAGDFGTAVLVSSPRAAYQQVPRAQTPTFVLAYQGRNDPEATPRLVRAKLTDAFRAFDNNPGRWALCVIEDEGHNFRRIDSWARVHSTIEQLSHRHTQLTTQGLCPGARRRRERSE